MLAMDFRQRTTRALMGPMASNLLRETVARALGRDDAIEIVHAENWEQVGERLRNERIDVLISSFRGDGTPPFEHVADQYPEISIVALDPSGFLARFRNPGSRALASVIRLMARCGEHVEAFGHSRVIPLREPEMPRAASDVDVQRASSPRDDDDGKRPGALAEAGVQCPATANENDDFGRSAPRQPPTLLVLDFDDLTAYADHDEVLADVCDWLEPALGVALLRNPPPSSGGDIAGWSMSVETAWDLLGIDPGEREIVSLLRRMRTVEECFDRRSEGVHTAVSPLLAIEHAFALSMFERRLLWLTLAPEIDERFARAIGVINNDLTQWRPTPALAAAIEGAERPWETVAALDEDRPAMRLRLVAADEGGREMPRGQAPLRCAAEIIDFVLSGKRQPLVAAQRLAAA